MELFYCDSCNTMAYVEKIGDELKIAQCNCVRSTLFNTKEAD